MRQRAKLAALARVPEGQDNRRVKLMASQATAEIGTLLEGQGRLDEAETALRQALSQHLNNRTRKDIFNAQTISRLTNTAH